MARDFNAKDFVSQLDAGMFDGGLQQALAALSTEELQEVALLLIKRLPSPQTQAATNHQS
jgi:hypothetical protein